MRFAMEPNDKNSIRIDFITKLPIELAEELISFLDGEDILIGCQVCREWKFRLDQDRIWKQLCQRKGLEMDANINNFGWRNVYWLNRNWSTGRYRQFTINGDDLHPTQHRSFQMDGNFLIVPRATSLYKATGINVWDLTDEPKLHQIIFNELGPKGKQFRAYKRFIVQQIGNFIRIHKNMNGKYEHFKLLHFKENVCFNGGIFQVVSDVEEIKHVEKFTPPIFEDEVELDIELESNMLSVHKHKKYIYLWNLDPWKPVSAIRIDGDPVSYIRIIPNRIFCVMSNSPIFRIYDLINKAWSMELNGNSRNPLFDINPSTPILYLTQHMISCFYRSGSESTFKLWNTYGELVRMIDIPRNLRFQCAFNETYILITSSEQTISVLSNKLVEIKQIRIESPCEAIDAGPGKLFILAYPRYYEVWDWKNGSKKHTIDLPLTLTRQVSSYFSAHEIHQHNHKIKINILNFTRQVKTPFSQNNGSMIVSKSDQKTNEKELVEWDY